MILTTLNCYLWIRTYKYIERDLMFADLRAISFRKTTLGRLIRRSKPSVSGVGLTPRRAGAARRNLKVLGRSFHERSEPESESIPRYLPMEMPERAFSVTSHPCSRLLRSRPGTRTASPTHLQLIPGSHLSLHELNGPMPLS